MAASRPSLITLSDDEDDDVPAAYVEPVVQVRHIAAFYLRSLTPCFLMAARRLLRVSSRHSPLMKT